MPPASRAEPRPPAGPPVARYLQVARAIERAIAEATYPVGSLIPTEVELAGRFGVSRQTVRQAIAHLRARRLLSARKGVGTRVEAASPTQGYYHAIQSLTELFRFAAETAFRVERTRPVPPAEALAAGLPRRAWLRLDGVREQAGAPVPLGTMTVFVDARHADLVAEPRTHTTAIFSQIERHHGEAITEVDQEIGGTLLAAAEAERLGAAPGAAALLVTRRYYATGRRLVELSHTLHPADRFRHAMTLRRQ